jgi:hypothetical protein
MSLARGDVVAGMFEVERPLESAAGLEVYRARHLLSGKRATLKVVKRNIEWCAEVIERARTIEAVADGALSACIHQGPAGRGQWGFAFEWFSTEEPQKRLPKIAPVGSVARIGASVASALGALHEEGFAHGHVRAERIAMSGRDADIPKLLDFVLAPDRAFLTANARYLAPELIGGDAFSAEADVFALGVILWQLAAGRPISTSDTRLGVFLETLFDTPDSVECGDEAVASWIARMLAFQPEARPEARRVEKALRTWLDGGTVPVLAPPPLRAEIGAHVDGAVAVLVIRPPLGKDAAAAGLTDAWRRDVEAHGMDLRPLPEGTLIGRVRGNNAQAVALSAGLIAKATQECAFRASVVAGLLDDASAGAPDGHASTPGGRVSLLRYELADIARIANRTPPSVTRFTARLAAYIGDAFALKPSADSYLLTPDSLPKLKRGGTLELDTTSPGLGTSPKKRKTGELVLADARLRRGKGGTLVIEPGPETSNDPDRRATAKDTLVIEPEPDEIELPVCTVNIDDAVSEHPTLEIAVDEELRQLSRRDNPQLSG